MKHQGEPHFSFVLVKVMGFGGMDELLHFTYCRYFCHVLVTSNSLLSLLKVAYDA